MIQLALILTQVLLTADAPLPVVAVTASSEKPNAPARALIDGKRDTSWQPDADGAYGLGQWIRVDLGTVFDVTSIKLHNGIQRIEGGADQFCRNARAGRVTVYGDSALVQSLESDDLDKHVYTTEVGKWGFQKPLRTRYVTIVIDGAELGFGDATSAALAELEVFGKPAAAYAPETGDVRCGSRRLAELRDAVVEYCAAHYRTGRPNAECALMRNQFDYCEAEPPEFLPIAARDYDGGRLELKVTSPHPPFPKLALTLIRKDGRWVAEALTCLRGRAACGLKHTIDSDGDRTDLELDKPKRCKAADGKLVTQ